MLVIATWTGRTADALRHAMRMTNESFAARLGVSVRTAANWRGNPDMVPETEMQAALDTELERAPNAVKARFAALVGMAYGADASNANGGQLIPPQLLPLDDIGDLLAQVTMTGASNDAIQQIEEATVSLIESHTRAPARIILGQVKLLHKQVQSLLAEKLRLSQQRDLYRIESLLLSHACLLLGDLNKNTVAERLGEAGLTFASEAGSDQAVAMTVLAKTLRWQNRIAESMEMARRGFECSPNTPIRTQLASQEANAAALIGNAARAREALVRAGHAAGSVQQDSGLSAWSFPIPRQAVFAQSVSTQLGDADGMLEAAAVADAAWSNGAARTDANWAQIRVGAATAYLMKGALDGAIAEVEPVLAIPPNMRVATVTAYTERLRRRFEHPLYSGAEGVRELSERLTQFSADALKDAESEEGANSQ